MSTVTSAPEVRGLLPAIASERRGRITADWLLIALALVVWGISLPELHKAKVTQWGLLASADHGLLISMLLVTAGFAFAIRRVALGSATVALLSFVAITRLTASLITPLPIFTWTYKHVGVVDHIMTSGSVDRRIDIYNAWPGFFSAAAWFSQLTGVSPITLARWFPVVVDLAIVAGMYGLSRAFGQSKQVALVAAFGIQGLNWVGQDYFSPQALGFMLALGVLTLLLHSRQSRVAGWLSVPLFSAVMVTHQLTPFWLCGIAIVLGVTGRIRPRWIGLLYLAIAIAYVLPDMALLRQYGLMTGFDPVANAQSNVVTAGNAGRELTSHAAKIPAVVLWLSAAFLALRGRLRRRPVWVPTVLAFTSFGLLAGQSYGGEAIFRVYLYSLPGCMLLVAPAVTAVLTKREGRLTVRRVMSWAVVPLTALVLTASLQAYYGTWFTNVVARDGLSAEENLLQTAPTNSLLLPITTGIAERPTGRYADFVAHYPAYDASLVQLPGIQGRSFTPTEVDGLTQLLRARRVPVYLIITEQMRRYAEYFGQFPPGALVRLVTELHSSSQWRTISDTSTLAIFQLRQ